MKMQLHSFLAIGLTIGAAAFLVTGCQPAVKSDGGLAKKRDSARRVPHQD